MTLGEATIEDRAQTDLRARITGLRMEPDKRSRLAEVAMMIWRGISIAGLGFALFVIVGTWHTLQGDGSLGVAGIYTIYAFALTFVVWAATYVQTGVKAPFFAVMRRAVLGGIPYYAVFFPVWLIASGMVASFGFMEEYYGHASRGDEMLPLFLRGVSGGMMLWVLGAAAGFLSPRRYTRAVHMIATCLLGLICLALSAFGLPILPLLGLR